MTDPPHRGAWSVAALPALVAAAGAVWLRSSLDLSDLPGPAGARWVLRLVGGNLLVPLFDPLVALGLHAGLTPLTIASALMVGSVALAAAGASLCGLALGGPRAGMWAGLLAAVWGPVALTGATFGPDGPALGLAWLGAGLALLGAQRGGWGLALLVMGVLSWGLGVMSKASAVAVAPVFALAPLLGRSWRVRLAAVAPCALVCLSIGILSGSPPYLNFGPTWSERLAALPGGLATAWDLAIAAGPPWPEALLVGIAALGVAAPGSTPRWARAAAFALGIGAVAIVTAVLGEWHKLRYFTVPALPFFALAGVAVSARGRWAIPLSLLGPLAFTGLVADSLQLIHQWAVDRAAVAGTDPPTLPQVRGWPARNHHAAGLMASDYTTPGAKALVALGRTGPPGGVAGVPLDDSRQDHLGAGAALAGIPWLLLMPARCCEDEPGPDEMTRCYDAIQGGETRILDPCAAARLREEDMAGRRLVLPAPGGGARLPAYDEERSAAWIAALARAAGPMRQEGIWWVKEPGGAEGRDGP